MRLAKLRNFKFSDLNFYHYFFALYFTTHIAFSKLLGNIMALAPDENLYRDIFIRLYADGFTSNVQGFQGAWVPWLRILYCPAKTMNLLGLSELQAIRFQSILYSALALYFIAKLLIENSNDSYVMRFIFTLFSFMPTLFLWSTLGLRESFLFAEISGIFFFLNRLEKEKNLRNYFGLFLSVFSLSMTKNYIFILFMFGFILLFAFGIVSNRKDFLKHLSVLLIAVFPLVCNPTLVPAISNYFGGQLAKEDTLSIGDFNNDGRCDVYESCASQPNPDDLEGLDKNGLTSPSGKYNSGGSTLHLFLQDLQGNPSSLLAKILNKVGLVEKLELVASPLILEKSDPEVLQNRKKLALQQAGLKNPLQVLKASTKFLIMPIMFMDNGSVFLNIQSYELPIWIIFYALFLYNIVRRFFERNFQFYIHFLPTIFIIEFIVISALTEINVGTALRHRSLLLIPIMYLLITNGSTKHHEHRVNHKFK
jgi:hypothetical protein